MKLEMTITKWMTRDRGSKLYRIDSEEPYYIPKHGVWESDEGHYEYIDESCIPSALRFNESGSNAIRKLEYRLVDAKSEDAP